MAEVGSVVLNINASSIGATAGFNKVDAAITGFAQKTDRRMAQWARHREHELSAVAAQYQRMANIMRAGAAGLFGGLGAAGLEGTIRKAWELNRSIAAIGDEAARAGVSVKAFQEFSEIAKQTRIPIDAMVDGLKELAIRGDEFVRTAGKSGSAAESFKRLGYSVEEVAKKLKAPNELFFEIMQRTRQLRDTAAGVRIMDEMFGGTAGEQFTRLLRLSDEELRNIQKASRDAGMAFDENLIRRADELDRKYSAMWRQFELNGKSAIVSVMSYMDDFIGKLNEAGNAEIFQKAADFIRDNGLLLSDVGVVGDTPELIESKANVSALERRAKMLEAQIANLRDLGFDATEAQRELAQARAELEAEVARILGASGKGSIGDIATELPTITVEAGPEVDRALEYIRAYRAELAKSADQRRLETEATRIQNDALAAGTELSREMAETLARETIARDENERAARKETSTAEKRASAYETLLKQVKQNTAALHAEQAAVAGLEPGTVEYARALQTARVEFDLLNAATLSGLKINPELEATIRSVAQAYGAAAAVAAEHKAATKETNDRLAETGNLIADIGQSLAGIFSQPTEDLWDFVDQVAKPVARFNSQTITRNIITAYGAA